MAKSKTVYPKTYGITVIQRDWKDDFDEIEEHVNEIITKHKKFDYSDVDNSWNDAIYTVVSNHPDMCDIWDELGEDLDIATMHESDGLGIIWFDTVEELKEIVKRGLETEENGLTLEEDESERLDAFGEVGKAKRDEYIAILVKPAHPKYKELVTKLPERSLGWSAFSSAVYLALLDLEK